MLRPVWLASLVIVGACDFTVNTGTSIDANGDGSAGSDGDVQMDGTDMIDAPMIDTMPMGIWHAPQMLGFTGASDPTLTGDMLQIWFAQGGDIYHASRSSVFQAFGTPFKVLEVSTTAPESSPEVAANGLSMTFARLIGNNDVYITTWDAMLQSWTLPVPLADLNTQDHEQAAVISDDRRMLAMTRNEPSGSADIYFSTRATPSDPWTTAVAETELNSNAHDGSVFLSPDKLTVCFDSQRASLQNDIYCATRTDATVAFDTPVAVTGINSMQSDQDPWLSPDGKVMVFWSDRDGIGKLWFSIYF